MDIYRKAPRHTGETMARHAPPKCRRNLGILAAGTIAVMAFMAPSLAYADAGFDNASYQGCYDANTAKANGASFSITKFTEGSGYTNPYAACQLATNRTAGLRLAGYDFARPDKYGAQDSSRNFTNVAKSLGAYRNGVIPVLDWEPKGNLKADVQWAYTWLSQTDHDWGTKPLIYMSAATIKMADWSTVSNANYGLWVAGYPRGYQPEALRNPGAPPYSVSPWPFAAAWQYSSSGRVPGVGNAVDVDWFYGDAVTWSKYANSPVGSVNNPVTSVSNITPAQGAPMGDANTLATEVINGRYGNNPQRRQLLGSRYNEVMAIVNQRIAGQSYASTGNGYYIVKSGDYLSKIWPRTWRSVASANNLRPPYTIYPGRRLVVPNGSGNGYSVRPRISRVLVIRRGDNLWNHFGARSYEIARANGIRNANMIKAGQVIHY